MGSGTAQYQLMFLRIYLCCVVGKVMCDVTSNIACTTTMTAGSDPGSADDSGPDTNRAFNYVAETPLYTFQCCGVITQWSFRAGNTGTLQLQVWRKMSTNVYTMIGENYYAVTSTSGTINYNVPTENQIAVQKGDFIGWHNQGEEILLYKFTDFTGSTLENLFHRINAGDLYPGDTYDWSTVEAYNDREYSLEVTYGVSSTPTISAPASVSVPDYMGKGAMVTRVLFTDSDVADNSSLTVYQKQRASFYTFDAASGFVTSNNDYRPQTVTFETAVYDSCLNLATISQTLTVTETAIVLDLMDATFTISEKQTSTLYLYTFTFTETVDQWYCSWTTTTEPFLLKAASTTSYSLWVVEYPTMEFSAVNSYEMVIRCTEELAASTNTITGTISIFLSENQPPILSNTDASVTVDAETAIIGDTVFTATATDPESDTLTFTMACGGGTCPFEMMKNGAVQLTSWLIPTTVTQYDMDITVTDSDGQTDVGKLLISVDKIDDVAVFTNIPPAAIKIKENTAIGTSIYTFLYEDLDYNTKIWSLTVSDNKFGRLLNLDPSTGLLSTAFSEINFEDLGGVFTYTMTLQVGDVKSSSTQTLDIEIINENEAPRFTKDNFHLDVDENADGTTITNGVIFGTGVGGYLVDEDTEEVVNSETHEYTLDCDTNTHRFYMTPSSGAIIYRGPYDLDTSGTPSQIECTLTVVDKLGLTDTARLHIHINNVNEYSPEFTSNGRSLYVSSNAPIGSYLLTVSAVDFDSSDDDDNVITYTLDQSALGTTLFAINEIGYIYTVASLTSYSAGLTLGPIYALASNYMIAGKTGTTTLSVVIPLSTTVATTTTDRNRDFYEDRRSYYWLLPCIFAGILMLLAVSLIFFRICRLTRVGPWCYRNCMKGICCRPSPEGPRGFGDMGYDLASFGHKHRYTDETSHDEFDGWLMKTRRKGQSYKKEMKLNGSPTPLIVNSDGRYGTPMTDYDDNLWARDTPVYEMLRVQTPQDVPQAASYTDPDAGSRGLTWKKQVVKKPGEKRSFW